MHTHRPGELSLSVENAEAGPAEPPHHVKGETCCLNGTECAPALNSPTAFRFRHPQWTPEHRCIYGEKSRKNNPGRFHCVEGGGQRGEHATWLSAGCVSLPRSPAPRIRKGTPSLCERFLPPRAPAGISYAATTNRHSRPRSLSSTCLRARRSRESFPA